MNTTPTFNTPGGTPASAHLQRILIVEDNPADARYIEILLMQNDLVQCEIHNEQSLADGMAAMEQHDYSAVLLDLTLPDSRHLETLDRFLDRFPDANVIVMTGSADKNTGVRAVKTGAQDFIVKGNIEADMLGRSVRFSIERSKAGKRLEETQRIAGIGNWEFRPEDSHFSFSKEVSKIFGTGDSIISYDQLFDEDCPVSALTELHEEALHRGEARRDLTIKRGDGTLRYASALCRREPGNNTPVFMGIIQDITERKLAELEIEKNRERYQDIFDKSRDAIYIVNQEGCFVDMNEATCRHFGFNEQMLKNMSNPHETLFADRDQITEFLTNLHKQRSVKDFEIVTRFNETEIRHCLLSANLIENEDLRGYSAILRDITERKQAEKLKKARDLAQQSAKMKERFIASVSHEMRTPMNAILGMSNILTQMELETEAKNLVGSIKQSSEILLGIVNDILEISTIQNGKVVFESKPFQLRELLGNLMNVMQYKAQEKDLYFELNIGDDVPENLVGDKLRLNQILYNLVGNAIKFTDTGYVKVTVEKMHDISSTSIMLNFIVEDTGIGIPPDKVEAVFETFTRIRQKERLFEGTGLGLSIVKNLVEQQGGKVGATSQPGQGSRFFFDLIFDLSDHTVEPEREPELADLDFDPDCSFRLLLAEDHKMNQLVARKTLERKFPNLCLVIAEDGQKAIEVLEKEDFDLILMDIQMPNMDGYEATRHLRAHGRPEVRNLPVLAMTAHAHIAQDKQHLEHGMDDYVLKPFKPEELFYKIGKYLIRKDRSKW